MAATKNPGVFSERENEGGETKRRDLQAIKSNEKTQMTFPLAKQAKNQSTGHIKLEWTYIITAKTRRKSPSQPAKITSCSENN
jgi:hypothetical protein